MAKPNQNHASMSFSTKMRVGLNRSRGIGVCWPLPATGVMRGLFSRRSIGASTLLWFGPERWIGVELEGLVVIAQGRGQLAGRRLSLLPGRRIHHQHDDAAAGDGDEGNQEEEFGFHWLP